MPIKRPAQKKPSGYYHKFRMEMLDVDTLELDDEIARNIEGLECIANPLFSAFCTGALESRKNRNVSGGTHRHFGCHGCASSTAVDSLAAEKQLVFEEKKIAPEALLEALENNFEGFEDIRRQLKECEERVGCGSDEADQLIKLLFDTFATILEQSEPTRFGKRSVPAAGRIDPETTLQQSQGSIPATERD